MDLQEMLSAELPDEGVTRKQLDFLNKFGVLHGLRHVPKSRNFDPRKATAVVTHALMVTRRSVDLFLLRMRRLVHRVKVLQRWFRKCLQRREHSFARVLARWTRSEETQRKSMKLRIYRDFSVRTDACRNMISTYVSKLTVSADRKKIAIQGLYWERSAQFREEVHAWWVIFDRMRALVTQLEARRRTTFEEGALKSLSMDLQAARLALQLHHQEWPRFRFDAGDTKLSELVNALSADDLPPRQHSEEHVELARTSQQALPLSPSETSPTSPHAPCFGPCLHSDSEADSDSDSDSVYSGESKDGRGSHSLLSACPTIEDYDSPLQRDLCLPSCLSPRKPWAPSSPLGPRLRATGRVDDAIRSVASLARSDL
eukprot:RCo028823